MITPHFVPLNVGVTTDEYPLSLSVVSDDARWSEEGPASEGNTVSHPMPSSAIPFSHRRR